MEKKGIYYSTSYLLKSVNKAGLGLDALSDALSDEVARTTMATDPADVSVTLTIKKDRDVKKSIKSKVTFKNCKTADMMKNDCQWEILQKEEDKSRINIEEDGSLEVEFVNEEKNANHYLKISGKSYTSLKEKLKELYVYKNAPTVPYVGCLLDINEKRKEVTYIIIDSVDASTIKSRNFWEEVTIPYIDDYDKEVMLETKLALYDLKYIYPITNLAKETVGKLLDAIASFKDVDAFPLGGALLLNAKIESKREFDILYEENGSLIRPLVSICSNNYGGFSPKEFIDKIKEQIDGYELFYDTPIWNIKNGIITVDFPISGFSAIGYSYEPIIRTQTSIVMGYANRVELLAKVGKGYISLIERSKYHQNMDIDGIIDGFKEEMEDFAEKVEGIYTFTEEDYQRIKTYIGTRRFANCKMVGLATTVKEFVNDTWMDNVFLTMKDGKKKEKPLGYKQRHQLMVEYANILKDKEKESKAS